MNQNQFEEIKEMLMELKEDSSVPKNVKQKINNIIVIINTKEEKSIKINKILNELDDIGDDNNLQPYTRTQVWNIVSILEGN